jgi:two-component system response regulator AtoC
LESPAATVRESARSTLADDKVLASRSPAGQAVERIIAEVAKTEIPVLILGESGTGKEVTARWLHRLSSRRNGSFVRCVCSSLNVATLEKLLQGKNDGQRSSASHSGMTLFLDGVGELSSACQQKLLQCLPEEAGNENESNLPVRVISSASGALKNEVEAGRLREELYYRLNGICIRLPRLCQRKEDIPVLADLFLTKYSGQFGKRKPSLSPGILQAMQDYSWPGNIRQLKNAAKRIIVLGDEKLALADVLSSDSGAEPEKRPPTTLSLKEAARTAAREAENHLILKALDHTRWNRKRAAKELGISYKALLYKLKQIGGGPFTKPE